MREYARMVVVSTSRDDFRSMTKLIWIVGTENQGIRFVTTAATSWLFRKIDFSNNTTSVNGDSDYCFCGVLCHTDKCRGLSTLSAKGGKHSWSLGTRFNEQRDFLFVFFHLPAPPKIHNIAKIRNSSYDNFFKKKQEKNSKTALFRTITKTFFALILLSSLCCWWNIGNGIISIFKLIPGSPISFHVKSVLIRQTWE